MIEIRKSYFSYPKNYIKPILHEKNMKNIPLLVLFIIASSFLSAQVHDNTVQKEAMKKLSFLEGTWNGTANMMVRGQGNQVIDQTEHVQFKLDSTILVIEGLGKSADEESKTVHHAFAIISYDETSETYRFKSWLENGLSGDYEAQFDDSGSFIWTMDKMNGGTVRYKINLDENGNWTETGEWSGDGAQWFGFFSMNLKKDI